MKEFSFSDYAIDDNLSRHTWKAELHGRWPGRELPDCLAGGRCGRDKAVLVRAWEGADEGPAGRSPPLAWGRGEGRPPGRQVARAAGPRALHASRL